MLEEYLRKIDAINMIAQVHVSTGALIAEATEHSGCLTSRQIVVRPCHPVVGDLARLVIPAPTVPKKDFRFLVRHALGPWTPVF